MGWSFSNEDSECCITAQVSESQESCAALELSRGRCAQAQSNLKGKMLLHQRSDANHISNLIMDASSPNKKTIDTKEEKWKLLLGEPCHDLLAGSELGPNPAVAGLGLSTPRQPAGRARLAAAPSAPSLLPLQYAQHLCCSLTPGWEG